MSDKRGKDGRRQDSSHLVGGAGGATRWQGLTPPAAEDGTTGEGRPAISPAAINAMSPGRFDLEMLNIAAKTQFEAASDSGEDVATGRRSSDADQKRTKERGRKETRKPLV